MVELTANGQKFEMLTNSSKIKITKQIADIFNLAAVTASYTNSFKIPKIPANTLIMQNLGIVGDTSGIPYQKTPSTLSKDGFSIFYNGWLSVSDTDEDYNVKILDGIVDFFKAIENKTMGADLNLVNFDHVKDLNTVVASFTNQYYTYLIADYNGKSGLIIDYMVPSFNMGKLLDLVMNTFGFTYDIENIEEVNQMYITYPNEILDPEENDVLVAELYKGFFEAIPQQVGHSTEVFHINQMRYWDSAVVTEGSIIQQWRYLVDESTGYKVTISTEMYAMYRSVITDTESYNPVQVSIRRNGQTIIEFDSNPEEPVTGEVNMYFDQGDIIELRWYIQPYYRQGRSLRRVSHNSTYLNIYKTTGGEVNVTDAFKDFPIRDFIKEVTWRTATIPVIDTVDKHITFKSIDDRLDYSKENYEDWSDKYVRRLNEGYLDGSYAQKNIFHHKYNDENDISQDGYLMVDNKNIDAEKTIVNSKIYAPENINTTFTGGPGASFNTKRYSIWQPEPKEDSEGNITVEYKGLTNRFYIMKRRESPVGNWELTSDVVSGSTTVNQVPYADVTGTTFSQIVPVKYDKYNWVLNNFRAHNIELILTLPEILTLDLIKPKYFRQEGAYYVLNKITFDEGKNSVGEFVRINKI